MAPPECRSYALLHGLIKFLTVLFIFSLLSILLPTSDGSSVLIFNKSIMVESKVGSSPPTCVNKCMNCKPCMATLVSSNNNDPIGKNKKKDHFIKSSHGDDDTYYLLHWKCKCGNKLYQP
ncbi:hypothetical protein PIB30_076119 [Stylosanthes scabra]|uniref:Epidermal patterning factor-like protein n=1 Tax=Stylosanthes scabra TaxID=79078 RepID=A0ABU6XRZ6_9FABA|nr:hypothetical protein [Stylosanthes scabra]